MSGREQHKQPQVSFMKKFGVFLLSAGCLLAAIWITSRIVELGI
jgi:hypothetical protein